MKKKIRDYIFLLFHDASYYNTSVREFEKTYKRACVLLLGDKSDLATLPEG